MNFGAKIQIHMGALSQNPIAHFPFGTKSPAQNPFGVQIPFWVQNPYAQNPLGVQNPFAQHPFAKNPFAQLANSWSVEGKKFVKVWLHDHKRQKFVRTFL